MFEKVKIKSENLIDDVVNIEKRDDKTIYYVESYTEGEIESRTGGIFFLFDCLEEEIEKI